MQEAFASDFTRGDELVIVDMFDRQTGTASKERAHREGLLHRAFSVMLWREGMSGIEFLLTQRAEGKYHSGGLWTNSCCSHPRAGEGLEAAVRRRVLEELGVNVHGLRELGSFVYHAPFENGLSEFEYDHVFIAQTADELDIDPAESSDVRWLSAESLAREMADCPEHFTAWSFTVMSMVLQELCPQTRNGDCG